MNLKEIKKLIKDYKLKPAKAKGQNFLINHEVLKKIAKTANLTKNDYILEIGPGFGILTEALLKSSKKVLAVELDKRLAYFLKQKFKGQKNLEILEADILKIKNFDLAKKLGNQKYKIVANLPYAISKPVLKKFLTYEPKPELMVVLLQKEVAEKIVAQSGKMSLLSLSVQFYGQAKIIDYVAKQNFYPQPQVESAILKIKINQTLPAEISRIKNFEEKKFWQIVKIGFSSPRKQLQNNLSAGLKLDKHIVKDKLKLAKLEENIRPEDLTFKNWADIYQQFMV